MRLRVAAVGLLGGILPRDVAAIQGHGPVYGLSTPTLARGGWSIDVAAMARVAGDSTAAMLRPMVSYGITEDLQISASFPMPIRAVQGRAPVRAMTRMPAVPDVEVLVGWRFHRRGTGVGSRLESTAYLGFDYPTDPVRNGVRTAPGVTGALATGYASRIAYVWVGGLYRRYMSPVGATADHPGDAAMYSLVVGYRPAAFRREFPRPDWRVFLEAVGEYRGRDVVGGVSRGSTGGHELFLGPTLLGLYGAWGISGGPVFRAYRRLDGAPSGDRVRIAIDFVHWF